MTLSHAGSCMAMSSRNRIATTDTVPLWHIEYGTTPLNIQPLVTIRYPEIRLRGLQVDTNLLPETVRRVDDAPHALVSAHLHELPPGHNYARIRHDRIDDRDDPVVLALETRVGRQDVETRARVCGLERTHLGAEGLHEVDVRDGVGELERMHNRTRRLGAIGKAPGGALDGAVGHGRCAGCVQTSTSMENGGSYALVRIMSPSRHSMLCRMVLIPCVVFGTKTTSSCAAPTRSATCALCFSVSGEQSQEKWDTYRACSSMDTKVARWNLSGLLSMSSDSLLHSARTGRGSEPKDPATRCNNDRHHKSAERSP